MGTLGIHQNIPASDYKLMPCLGIDDISPPLIMDKLLPVSSKAITSSLKTSLLLQVQRTCAVIIKTRLILVTCYAHGSHWWE